MRYNLNSLLTWKIPDKEQILTRRDVAFYALSVGAGRDPRDRDQLKLADPGSADLVALPSMVLVLGYPGFWLGDPRLGLDPGRILHVEQSIDVLGPVPLEGRVVGRTRILDVVDRGGDKGALVISERKVSDDQERVFAILQQTHMLRGDDSASKAKANVVDPELQSRQSAAAFASVETDIRPEQALLYRLNGDMNPLHSDPLVAGSAGFPGPIVHGMCTFGIAARALIDGLCEGRSERLLSMSARFTGPVYPGETLRTEIEQDGSFRAVAVERNAPILGDGRARITIEEKMVRVPSHVI